MQEAHDDQHHRLTALYAEVATTSLGWDATPQKDGDLRVTVDDEAMWITLDGVDPSFMRIWTAYRVPAGDPEGRERAAAATSQRMKLAAV